MMRINYNLACEVDTKKVDCKREPPHCHITRNGISVAQVWLNSVYIEPGHQLDHNEIDPVLCFVRGNQYELVKAYRNNAENGAD